MLKHTSRQKAFTLVEMIIYISFLVIMLGVMIQGLVILMGAYRTFKSVRDMNESALASMTRLGFEIRDAVRINTGSSVFDTHPGVLSLVTDDGVGEHTKVFSNGADDTMQLSVDGISAGALTRATSTAVTSLVFRHIVDTSAEAIRVEMTIESYPDTGTTTKTFFDTFTLRNPE